MSLRRPGFPQRAGASCVAILLALAACAAPPDGHKPPREAARSGPDRTEPAIVATPEATVSGPHRDHPASIPPDAFASEYASPDPFQPDPFQEDSRRAALPVIPEAPPVPVALTGMDKPALIALLGAPAFRRLDPPAVLWRYDDGPCLLDIYFRLEGETATVIHYELRSPDRGDEALSRCFGGRVLALPGGTPS